MDEAEFADRTNDLFRAIYERAARRVADARERLSPETTALMLHLAQTGPVTLTELAAHLARAPSTLSVKIGALEAQGLLARQADSGDGRRALLWLSPSGRDALADALRPLDATRLGAAAALLAPADRASVVRALAVLHDALAPRPGETP